MTDSVLTATPAGSTTGSVLATPAGSMTDSVLTATPAGSMVGSVLTATAGSTADSDLTTLVVSEHQTTDLEPTNNLLLDQSEHSH